MLEKERIEFPVGMQRQFIEDLKAESGKNWKDFREFVNINKNTLKNYRHEKCRLSLSFLKRMSDSMRKNHTEILKKYKAKKVIWEVEKPVVCSAQHFLGKQKINLNEGKILFENKNKKIDTKSIEFSFRDNGKKIKLPKSVTPELAEEVGIHLGDGFLPSKKYEFRVKGDKILEKEYYENFISVLYKKLYNVDLNLKEYEKSFGFELYSKAISQFKIKCLGIKAGRKDDIEIPDALKINDKKILCALIRGFFDTDGCVYFKSQGKLKKSYPVISACSKSKNLAFDFHYILKMLGFKVNLYETKKGYFHLVMNGYANFNKYSKIVGWNNPKHEKKVLKAKREYPELLMTAVV